MYIFFENLFIILLRVDKNMKFFLSELKINGCKNIDKMIDLRFCNKTITKNMNLEKSKIKAIYGPNGAGKSAIMSAMYIYKKLICDNDGLNDKIFSNFVKKSINKELKKMEIELTFLFFNDNNRYISLRHLIIFNTQNEEVFIEKEKLYLLKGRQIIDENFKEIASIENGKLILIDGYKNVEKSLIYAKTINLLDKNSILIITKKMPLKDVDVYILLTRIFAAHLFVHMEEDLHENYISDKLLLEQLNNYSLNEEDFFIKSKEELNLTLSIKNDDCVAKNYFEDYKKFVKRLEQFLKIFKPNLTKIEIEKKINGDKYFCKKILHYENFAIDIEFESTGIKKLVRLFNVLKACTNGKIVFIDEFDANLHDVYFAKLIEFMKDYSEGQLCFTTHNIEPINILKSNSHSLDFLSNDSRLTSWTKNGNKSPLNKYVNGLIEYSPFNVSSIDFIQSLINDEE